MQEYRFIITAENGMHARPAGLIANSLRRFSSDIEVSTSEKKADGKRLLSLMSLGAARGTELTFRIDGADELEACGEIEKLCREHLSGGV